SVPPEVKITSLSRAPNTSATARRASPTIVAARWPAECTLDGLPGPASSACSIATRASGARGAVAAASRYWYESGLATVCTSALIRVFTSAGRIEAQIQRDRAMGDFANRDDVHAGAGDCGNALKTDPAACFAHCSPSNDRDTLLEFTDREIIEQHTRDTCRER